MPGKWCRRHSVAVLVATWWSGPTRYAWPELVDLWHDCTTHLMTDGIPRDQMPIAGFSISYISGGVIEVRLHSTMHCPFGNMRSPTQIFLMDRSTRNFVLKATMTQYLPVKMILKQSIHNQALTSIHPQSPVASIHGLAIPFATRPCQSPTGSRPDN